MLVLAETISTAALKPRRIEPRFPDVMFIKGRGYVLRSALNQYKAALQAFALGVQPVEPPTVDPDPLVPLKQVSVELGVGRRTVGRRIKAAASEAA